MWDNNKKSEGHRMAYRRANDTTAPLHSTVRDRFMELDEWFTELASEYDLDGRSVAVVKTKLDEAIMWANRAVALISNADPEPERK